MAGGSVRGTCLLPASPSQMQLHTTRHSFKSKSVMRRTLLVLRSACREFMKSHLLVFNTSTCTALYITGDLIQQRIEGSKTLDWNRTLRMAILGVCMGPLNHGWYRLLDRVLVGTSGRTVFRKVLADQVVMAPICCSFFYVGMCTLERRSLAETKHELATKFWPTYKTDWSLWPAAQTLNFFLVPEHLRVTYVNIVTLVWTVYLSYMKHKWKVNEEKLHQGESSS